MVPEYQPPGLAVQSVSKVSCSSSFRPPFNNENVEISEHQQHQEPEDTHCGSIADTLVDKTRGIDIDDDVVGGVARAPVRHGPVDGELVEAPDACGREGH